MFDNDNLGIAHLLLLGAVFVCPFHFVWSHLLALAVAKVLHALLVCLGNIPLVHNPVRATFSV